MGKVTIDNYGNWTYEPTSPLNYDQVDSFTIEEIYSNRSKNILHHIPVNPEKRYLLLKNDTNPDTTNTATTTVTTLECRIRGY